MLFFMRTSLLFIKVFPVLISWQTLKKHPLGFAVSRLTGV
jgi:hypothetical protein